MSIVEIKVDIDCPGCEKKIKKALSKLDGIDTIDIDTDLQKVRVTGWVDQEKVLQTVRKTVKTAELWPFPYNPEYNAFAYHYGQYDPAEYSSLYTQGNQTSPNYYYYSGQISEYKQTTMYNYSNHGYNQQSPSSTTLGEQSSNMFSDDNVNACTIT